MSLLAAAAAFALSSAPGWREMRWFAACAATAGGFLVGDFLAFLGSPFPVTLAGSHLTLFFAGLHVASWYAYATSARGRDAMTPGYRAISALSVLVAFGALVPGLYYLHERGHRPIPTLGLTLDDPLPTTAGKAAFAYYCATLAILFVDYVTRWFRREPAAGAHVVALGALLVAGAHDSLVSSNVLSQIYLLEPAMLVVVVSVGGALTARFVATARTADASARKLARAHEELVKHERLAALGQLAATIAHEVRNPLAVVFNAVAGLRRAKPGSNDHEELLGIVQEEAERLRDMVSDLLEFARPRPPVLASAKLDVVVTSAADAAARAANAPEGDVSVTVAGNVPPLVCDEQLVRQAIINLVSNALQAEGRSGPVRVTIADSEATVTIRVSDDGRGIPADLRDRIFTPFFSTRPTGTGLGLAVVQRSAETHGGEVAVTATPGGGATFELRLPRRMPSSPDIT